MARALPTADLYALSWDRAVDFSFGDRKVHTTFVDRLGPLRDRRDWQLPFMPLAWRYATRRSYDTVVTSSHACVKGFWPARAALHLCYCYTPMRYVWLPRVDERRPMGPVSLAAARMLRSWDLASTRWVDEFAAISSAVQDRIRAFYDREARVIHPPVDTSFFTPGADGNRRHFAIAVSRMVPYKRLDLVINACHAIGVPLVVAGSGPDEHRLRSIAARLGADATFIIGPSDESLRDLYRTASVAVFAADEDFGIMLVEAQACGAPVVALGRGGSVDIVVTGETGVLVEEQDADCFRQGIEAALEQRFAERRCRENAERFSFDRFEAEFRNWVYDSLNAHGRDPDRLLVA